jgi:hypothetical protein
MSRLVVNPGTAQAWEIHLKPGANSIGRADSNDFKINHPSVSSAHCQIEVNNHLAVLRDTGSTNGTFVAGSPVQEGQLQHGQVVQLGGVEMIFYSDATAGTVSAATNASRPVVKLSAILGPPPATGHVAATPTGPVRVAPPLAAPPRQEGAAEIAAGTRYCKYHPQSPARHLCPRCNRSFCDICINTIQDGERLSRRCRTCGEELLPFQFRAAPTRGFYEKLPGAFSYPLKGAGVVILICATIAFAALNFIGGGIFGLAAKAALCGFVFLFMQNIILTTTSDEKDGLCFPDPSNLYGAALQLFGTVLASFWPALALVIARYKDMAVPPEAIVASIILGGIYFPMALLVVAMKDTALAANPLVVIPAIFKVPVKYSITAGLVLIVFGIRWLGDVISGAAGRVTLRTHDMNKFFEAIAIQMALALLSVYLLVVCMRLLGLFYNSTKQKLGWFSS